MSRIISGIGIACATSDNYLYQLFFDSLDNFVHAIRVLTRVMLQLCICIDWNASEARYVPNGSSYALSFNWILAVYCAWFIRVYAKEWKPRRVIEFPPAVTVIFCNHHQLFIRVDYSIFSTNYSAIAHATFMPCSSSLCILSDHSSLNTHERCTYLSNISFDRTSDRERNFDVGTRAHNNFVFVVKWCSVCCARLLCVQPVLFNMVDVVNFHHWVFWASVPQCNNGTIALSKLSEITTQFSPIHRRYNTHNAFSFLSSAN